MKKWVLIIIVLAALGGLGWGVYHRLSTAQQQERRRGGKPAIAVKVAAVEKGSLLDVGSFSGSLQAKSQFVVSAKVGGKLEKLSVNMGDMVHNGDLIATLDDDEYQQAVDQAQAAVEVAKAGLEEANANVVVALSELERIRKLREKNISSQSELDVAESRYKAASARKKVNQATVQQREAELGATKIRLSYAQVRASWEGEPDKPRIVGERYVDEGSLLKANDPIVSILENDVITGVIYVADRDYPKVKPGQEATVTTYSWPHRTFKGKVVRVAPGLKVTSRQAPVELEIPNPKVPPKPGDEPERLLKPGMFIQAQILFGTHEDVTVVPFDAIVRRNKEEGVFLADEENMKAKFFPIVQGISNGQRVEVTEPKDLAGKIVVMGQHLLTDDSTITIPEASPATDPAGAVPDKNGASQ